MSALRPGFANPVFDSQSTFRALMDATARPGTICDVKAELDSPAVLPAAAAAILLSLADSGTPIHLGAEYDNASTSEYLAFHTGAHCGSSPEGATFALVGPDEFVALFERFDHGSAEFPDRSATVIVPIQSFTDGPILRFTGPGIKREAMVSLAGLPAGFVATLSRNRARFSLGVDLVLVVGSQVMALPRSVRVETV